MSLVNTLFLNQCWTTWKPEWGVVMLELFFTLHQHAFCVFLHVGQAVWESLFLLQWWDSVTHPRSTDDIQKLLLIPWAQIPITWEICKCGMRCTCQWKSNARGEDHDWKRNKRIGIHEIITVSHSLWCHTTVNNFSVFHKVLVHHTTTVMWNGGS